MTLYENIKAMVHSLDGDTNFFDVLAGVLQGPLRFIQSRDYVLQTSAGPLNEIGFTLQKARSRRYLAKTITDTDHADDLVLITDKVGDTEKLLHALEDAAAQIGL